MGRRKKAATLRVVCCALFKALLDAKAMKRGDAERFRVWRGNLEAVTAHNAKADQGLATYRMAMNRFAVKAGCEVDFERRWAERESKLPAQPGFLGFSLLRKRKDLEGGSAPPSPPNPEDVYNYSTCTIWTSFKQWSHWRDGEGRYSHDASNKAVARTPISEWLDAPASPIFWDGLGMVLSESGV